MILGRSWMIGCIGQFMEILLIHRRSGIGQFEGFLETLRLQTLVHSTQVRSTLQRVWIRVLGRDQDCLGVAGALLHELLFFWLQLWRSILQDFQRKLLGFFFELVVLESSYSFLILRAVWMHIQKIGNLNLPFLVLQNHTWAVWSDYALHFYERLSWSIFVTLVTILGFAPYLLEKLNFILQLRIKAARMYLIIKFSLLMLPLSLRLNRWLDIHWFCNIWALYLEALVWIKPLIVFAMILKLACRPLPCQER